MAEPVIGAAGRTPPRWRVLGLGPLGSTDPRLAAAVTRGGGLGVLELGPALGAAETVARTRELAGRFGVRLRRMPADPGILRAGGIQLLVLADATEDTLAELGTRLPELPVLAEVGSLEQARAAAAAGAHGLIAMGSEAGELTSFVLLQRLLAAGLDLPVWACGGIGPHTGAGAVACGAAGVVLDSQLGLFPESDLPRQPRARLARMDGSEGELAALFARRYRSAETAVRSMLDSLAWPASRTDPHAQGEPLRRTLGVRHAVAQGPMTRVSDQPGFAAAVAEHGGMPYVAVATASGERTAELLRRTAEAMGDRPWGAGILGFVPEELRAEQLAALRHARPRSVLIAGGKPAQAAALEAEGIATYLHVPSPILLGQYLEAGARRFVFEGAECGGHIGPRTSFPLWETQLSVLLDFLDRQPSHPELEVFFAGGVHDATSAAMVAAMAAPLAERGVGVGVLMGTAYLFTTEAVRHGAITGLFQREAVRAERTATLETAPGHLTRCLDSPYVAEFGRIATELRDSELPAQQRWQRLEELNTGRLRIASKGIRRQGAELLEVDEAAQLAEGMYLAGQVAVLRDATTSIAELHREVTEGAAALLAANREQRPPTRTESPAPLDVAVIGMSCVFPGAPDLPAFWSNVLRGVDSVTEVPPQRWDTEVYYREHDGQPGTTPSKWGGFIPPVPFDPMSFGIPPASVGSIDPAQLLSLEVARRALHDAGYGERPFDRERAGVIFGAEAGGDLANAGVLRALLPGYADIPAELAEQLPELTEDSFPGTLANVISGRIANRLDLGGPNYTVDAACASSLAALDLACRELTAGTSDLVLCGAVDLHNGINDYLMFASAGALSPTGRCRPFDGSGDGIALGEGVACLVLKRLAEAERDGDRIYAVVDAVGAASDGRSLGLTAPRPEGQRRALERAYASAGRSPAEVGMIEAHGTGTVVGDGTELGTLTEFFTAAGARQGTCALGSVKSQIGHTKCAAGLAGLIKTALSLWFGVIPPTLHLTEPVAAWRQHGSPFTFGTTTRPWAVPRPERVAGVSAFGFGGTNFHAVLSAGPAAPIERHGMRDWPAELFLFRGESAIRELLGPAEDGAHSLAELAALASGWADAGSEPVHAAVVARDHRELVAALRAAMDGGTDPNLYTAEPATEAGALAFLFPGQGSQHTGMLAELFTASADLRRFLDTAPAAAAAAFPPHAFTPEVGAQQQEALRDTRVAQPALGFTCSALAELLTRLDIRPELLAGHSYGELVALSVAGAFDHPTLHRLSEARAEAILAAAGGEPGAMAAVRAGREMVCAVLERHPELVLANHNAPEQVVLSGPADAIDRAVEQLRAESVAAKRIPVACAFHSPLVAGAATEFAASLATERIQPPSIPVWSNRTARAYPSDVDGPGVRAELAAQLGAPVRFAEQIENMYAEGARTFVEVGPGSVLTGLVSAVLEGRPHRAIACEPAPDAGLRGLLTAVARLATAGVEVRTEWLFRGRVEARPAGAPRPGWTVDGQLARRADGTRLPGGLVPAQRISRWSMPDNANNQTQADRDQVVVDFLRGTREMVAAQRDVLLGYLGGAAAAPVPPPAPPVLEAPAPRQEQVAEPDEPPVESEVDAFRSVLEVIGDRTGYPAEMIDGDLDLEADLSIDSIKRTEIAGTLIGKLGLDAAESDDLGSRRTARGMTEWIEGRLRPAQPPEPDGAQPRRFLLRPVSVTAQPAEGALRGRRVTVVHGPAQEGLAAALLRGLVAAGAVTDGSPDTAVLLGPLGQAEEPVAPQVFGAVRDAVHGGVTSVLVAAPHAGGRVAEHAAGLRGLVRAIGKEREDLAVRLVELDPAEAEQELVAGLLAELAGAERVPVVRLAEGQRSAFELAAAELGSVAHAGAGPAGAGEAEARAVGLERDSVVLLIGGARGITARFAGALALASGCRIELAGRTPWPPEQELPAELAEAGDAELRRALAAEGRPLAEVETQVRAIRAQREVGRTMEAVRAAGGTAGYRPVDVRDGAAVRQLVKDVHTRYGRLDGVVYAAGIIDDRLMSGKDDASFRRVFGTKVDGAQALLGALEAQAVRPRFVTFFGSIAAVLGNRGQTDYAAANDALETLGANWAARTGNRVLTVHWGPWAPADEHGGMVSGELAREYHRRGVRLIDPEEGTACLLRELAYGSHDTRAVVYTASVW
ncbi:type I polyketide synthase [Amycolatopsis aidingensis]|uniref:type I polyketide synthase n=1 Tax=Amycolatopsis aidingensis TaxID=2842453 RepID=UPI001C0BE232|nr:type I polyketide synthase [Amycolatopsis aidingensis]